MKAIDESAKDRELVQRWQSMLCQKGCIDAYLLEGRLVTRSVGATREHDVPPGAEWIGRYRDPCTRDVFREDLALARAAVAGRAA